MTKKEMHFELLRSMLAAEVGRPERRTHTVAQIADVYDTIGIDERCVRTFTNVHHRSEQELQAMVAEVQFLGRYAASPAIYANACRTR